MCPLAPPGRIWRGDRTQRLEGRGRKGPLPQVRTRAGPRGTTRAMPQARARLGTQARRAQSVRFRRERRPETEAGRRIARGMATASALREARLNVLLNDNVRQGANSALVADRSESPASNPPQRPR